MQKVIQNRSLTRALVGAIDERKMHSPDAWGKYFGCVYREGCEKKRGCRPSLLRFQDLLAALRRGAPRIFWARMRGGLAQRRRGADRPGRALLMQACWKAERARILTPSPVAPMAASTLEWPLPSAPPLGRAELGRAGPRTTFSEKGLIWKGPGLLGRRFRFGGYVSGGGPVRRPPPQFWHSDLVWGLAFKRFVFHEYRTETRCTLNLQPISSFSRFILRPHSVKIFEFSNPVIGFFFSLPGYEISKYFSC